MSQTASIAVGLLGSTVLAVSGIRLRWLSVSGALAVIPLGTVLFGFGGPRPAGLIVFFFVTASLASGLTNRHKAEAGGNFAKGKARDWAQVTTNGGVPAILTVADYIHPGPWYLPAIVGAIAAVTADTWATELGTLSGGRVINCLSFRRVPPGTSGGVSAVGTLWAAGGAISLAVAAGLSAPEYQTLRLVLAGTAGGFLGAAVDSILGAGLQADFRCAVCGRATEKPVHCGRPAVLAKGWRFLGNDGVNLTAAVVGAAAAWGLWNL